MATYSGNDEDVERAKALIDVCDATAEADKALRFSKREFAERLK